MKRVPSDDAARPPATFCGIKLPQGWEWLDPHEEYGPNETVSWRLFPQVWGFANLVGVMAHGFGIVWTATRARMDLTMQVADVSPQVCNPGAANLADVQGVVRVFGLSSAHDISLPGVVIAFFALSFTFHFIAMAALLSHAYTNWGKENRAYRLYQSGLYHNLAFWRWLEYFFSASIMLIILGSTMGVREIRSIQASVGTMATVILFGWMTDLNAYHYILDKPYPIDALGIKEFTRQWKPGSRLVRWQVHLFGYIPYVLCWVLTLRGYDNAVQAFDEFLPDFVNTIVFGTITVFTLFGVVQAVLQILPYGPSLYAWGELVYIVLSFAAKAELGIIVVEQALVEGAIYDGLLYERFDPALATCADRGFP